MKKICLTLFFASVICCSSHAANFSLKLFLQGYYQYPGSSYPMLDCNSPSITDTIIVEFHDTLAAYVVFFSQKELLYSDGSVTDTFPDSLIGRACYIGIRHRNTLETWSNPITLSSNTRYDFSNSYNKSCGNDEVQIEPAIYVLRSGDVNQDGKIDQTDSILIVNSFGTIRNLTMDLNCDQNVDSWDIHTLMYYGYYTPTGCPYHNVSFVSSISSHPLNISPNPVQDNLTINFSGELNTQATVFITNVLGEMMYSSLLPKGETKKEMNVSYFPRGIYFIVVQTEEGQVVEKFVKQ